MQKLDRSVLWSLEEYATRREAFRAEIIAHKKCRQVHLGEHVTLAFEDFSTMKYQVQEMLRVERIFEPAGIAEEIEAYNPLIPDGANWKATMLIEYDDPAERKVALSKLIGVEDRVWVRVGATDRVFAIADEDMERENATKTSSVHFLRFELPAAAVTAAKSGEAIAIGIDFPDFSPQIEAVAEVVRCALVADLD